MADANLYSDSFTISRADPLKYERVVRLDAQNEMGDTAIHLDVNSELFPCEVGDRLQIQIASTLSLDGSKDDGRGWKDLSRGEPSLADDYDYVCHGKIYRFQEAEGDNIQVFISFGGLLLHINGPYKNLTGLKQDYVYLCCKK